MFPAHQYLDVLLDPFFFFFSYGRRVKLPLHRYYTGQKTVMHRYINRWPLLDLKQSLKPDLARSNAVVHNGARTHDLRIGNPTLQLLSYAIVHHNFDIADKKINASSTTTQKSKVIHSCLQPYLPLWIFPCGKCWFPMKEA